MGAKCCIAVNDKPPPVTARARFESNSRNITRHSPSWSFRWDHRTHIEDIIATDTSRPDSLSLNSSVGPAIGSQLDSSKKGEASGNSSVSLKDQSMEHKPSFSEIKDPNEPSSSAITRVGPAPSDNPEPSRRARRSPGYQLYRQVSDSRIPSLRSLNYSISNSNSNSNSISPSPEGGIHLHTLSLHSLSSGRFSLSSLDSNSIITKTPSSPGLEICKVCSRLLMERSPFSTQKIFQINENPVISVLPCGHLFHSDCLENVTRESDRFEPNCPVCTFGEKFWEKLVINSKGSRVRVSRSAVADIDADSDSSRSFQKGSGDDKKGKGNSGKPFLKRHFSIGTSRPDGERKKGFWRYWKD